jgi:hypothetical protein
MQTRVLVSISSRGRIGKPKWSELRDATLRMGRSIKGVPATVANVWYGFTRSEPRNSRGHLCGAWPDVARAFAEKGAPLSDVMAPAYEVERELKRDIYRRQLPPLSEIEAIEADVACRIQNAEITGDVRSLREAAHEERLIAELLEEAADQELDVKSA